MKNLERWKWVTILSVCSFSASIFQVGLVRIMSYSFPFHMMFAISLISGIALFCWGAGAACAKWFSKRLSVILIAVSFVMPAALLILSLFGKYQTHTVFPFIGSAVIAAFPFYFFGVVGGICYENQQRENNKSIPILIALGAVFFFAGFAGSSYAVIYTGVWNLVFISSLITLFTALGVNIFIIFVPVLSVLIVLINPGEKVFSQLAKAPVFWFSEGGTYKWVGGGWSPYARVDFYDKGEGVLAGLYNGVQYWITGPPVYDVKLRRELYKNITGDVVVIGSGGGHGLLSLKNASRIDAVELDPEIVRFMAGPLAKYNDNIYNRIDVAHAGDGRAYMENTDILYDNIILEAAEVALSNHPRSFISFENHLYTVEAMELYINRLKEEGVLFVIHTESHVPTEKFLRAIPEGIYFKLLRIPIVIHGNIKARFVTSVTIASRSEEKLEEIYLHLRESKVGTEDITEEFKNSKKYINAKPVKDNSPALHYRNIRQIIPFIAGAILFALVAIGGVFKTKNRRLGTFFVLTGAAFMINQLFIINVLRSGMGGYMETAALSLGFLTTGASLGAIYSRKMRAVPTFVGVVVFTTFSIMLLSNFPFHYSFAIKLILIFAAIFPTAFFTGVLYPKGMVLVSEERISYYLAIDTAASASGFLFFYIMVTLSGFVQTAVIAMLLYTFASLMLIKMR